MIKPYIVLEAAKSHDGDIEKAVSMIRAAKESGADAIKFQAYNKEDIITTHKNYDRYMQCHLSVDALKYLSEIAKIHKIDFYCSVFSYQLIDTLASMMCQIKIPSTFFLHETFVRKCIRSYKKVHISTGMHSMKDILLQIDKYNKYNTSGTEIIYYNCTSEYPTKPENVHLNRHKSKFMEGFSDHSSGAFAMVLASIIGVKYIEKHFSIDVDAKPWNVSTTQMRWYNRMMEMINEFFVDKGMSEEEIKNYEFYKKEFKDLSFLI